MARDRYINAVRPAISLKRISLTVVVFAIAGALSFFPKHAQGGANESIIKKAVAMVNKLPPGPSTAELAKCRSLFESNAPVAEAFLLRNHGKTTKPFAFVWTINEHWHTATFTFVGSAAGKNALIYDDGDDKDTHELSDTTLRGSIDSLNGLSQAVLSEDSGSTDGGCILLIQSQGKLTAALTTSSRDVLVEGHNVLKDFDISTNTK